MQPEPDGEDTIGLDNLDTAEGFVEGGDRVAHVESWSDFGPDGSTDESVHGHHDEGLIDVSIDSDIKHEPYKWQGSVYVEVGSIGEELGGPSDTTSEESDILVMIEDRGLSDDERHSEELDSDQPIHEGDLDETDKGEEGYGMRHFQCPNP